MKRTVAERLVVPEGQSDLSKFGVLSTLFLSKVSLLANSAG